MAKIGILNAEKATYSTDADGKIWIAFQVSPECRGNIKSIVKDIQSKVVVSIEKYKSRRSIEQNRLMWRLLEIMAQEQGVTSYDCYLDMIEEFGTKFEYIECIKEAVPTLKEMFRAIKIVEERKDGKTVMCKVFTGSSQYNTAEMKTLIDSIFDRLAEMGVSADKEVSYLWGEWKG